MGDDTDVAACMHACQVYATVTKRGQSMLFRSHGIAAFSRGNKTFVKRGQALLFHSQAELPSLGPKLVENPLMYCVSTIREYLKDIPLRVDEHNSRREVSLWCFPLARHSNLLLGLLNLREERSGTGIPFARQSCHLRGPCGCSDSSVEVDV